MWLHLCMHIPFKKNIGLRNLYIPPKNETFNLINLINLIKFLTQILAIIKHLFCPMLFSSSGLKHYFQIPYK